MNDVRELKEEALLLSMENAELRERIATQKQTIQAYRDESREWREVAAARGSENAKLRELLIDVSKEVPWSFMDTTKYYMPLQADKLRKLLLRMRELGVEVSE